jgi:hypothetical protein
VDELFINPCYAIIDIYIANNTMSRVAFRLFSILSVQMTALSGDIIVTFWCRKLVCSSAMMPGSNCRLCSGFKLLGLGASARFLFWEALKY